MNVGPIYQGNNQCTFRVWAPSVQRLDLELHSPHRRTIPFERSERGYWQAAVGDVPPGTTYLYKLNGNQSRPDPASPYQPEGVHLVSQVVDHAAYPWEDRGWRGIDLPEMVIYELHVGAFSADGTFEAIIPRLEEIRKVGINTIEIMPIAQFPGARNWGYDGVHPYAVQNTYGGPTGMKRLVNACHSKGIAVILDVVYNHLGPEGNYLGEFGPYFTHRYHTLWGDAVNLDGPHSDQVRDFFVENALYWFDNYHIDGLRLDAVHAMYDMSARTFLAELADRTAMYSQSQGRKFFLIAESSLNNTRLLRPRENGGDGLDAQWLDDFHHCVHTLLTGEKDGYFEDYGSLEQLQKSFREGYVYTGEYSRFRKRRHGNSSSDRPASQFVVFTKNHDQIGNRMMGERLTALVPFEAVKLSAAITLSSPYIPLLFMGEEYAEEAPFPYFVSHIDPGLVDAIRKGRRDEFRTFKWSGEPPDPQSPATFELAKLHWDSRKQGNHKAMLDFTAEILRLRRNLPALSRLNNKELEATIADEGHILIVRRWNAANQVVSLFNFDAHDVRWKVHLPGAQWHKVLDSSDRPWGGPGSLLPDVITEGDTADVRSFSAGLYINARPGTS
jgi:maltooligosyltrehalose trehalohydrolase